MAKTKKDILWPTDKELRQERNLPDTNIETDSYIAVQLLEQQGKLNFSTIRTAS